jgi:hypothetical protein
MVVVGWHLATAPARAAEPAPSFRNQIAPLLQGRCLRCHSGARPKGDLDLSSRKGMLSGGASGNPAVAPGKAAASPLLKMVADRKMPPRQPLDATEVMLFRRWIDAGASWDSHMLTPIRQGEERRAGPDWWSLQPIRRPATPFVADRAWLRNTIDAFILARLESMGLRPAPEADRRTVLRRLSFDLTGLPPTPAECQAFLDDPAPDAYERQVERLLASTAYGERWGRHWLDVVRFAESHGYEMNTLRPNAWPYRDYVIRAFNEDRPFAGFVQDQLAGDGGNDPLAEAATGFLVGGTHDMVGNATREGQLQQRMDDLYDMVSATGAAFLGMTVNCARCHDHKFDPILQKDFYGLQAVFAGVQHAERPLRPHDEEQRRHQAEVVRAEIVRLDRAIDDLDPPVGEPGMPPRRAPVNPRRNLERFRAIEARYVRFVITATQDGTQPCIDELEVYTAGPAPRNVALAGTGARASASSVFPNNPLHKIEHVNDGQVGNGRSWISNEPGGGWIEIDLARPITIDRVIWGRDREQKFTDRLTRAYRIEVSTDHTHWRVVAGSWDRRPVASGAAESANTLLRQRQRLQERLAGLAGPALVYAGTFAEPAATHLLKRGDPLQPLEEVGPSAIRAVNPPLVLDPKLDERSRRLALARWIGDVRNPLPARVMVNRLWHYHFGQGLVRTPSDFGFNGDRPSHPELLDWLAAEYLANGGHLKSLHRWIVSSAAYRQSSRSEARALVVDAGDRLLWRFPPRRLEAEAVRDAMLQVSGTLNRRLGGPGYHLWDYSGYVIVFTPMDSLGPDEFRRMVYQFKPRTQQDATFGAFDCPDATQAMPRRNVSTTALQALNLQNGSFVREQAERFAERLRRESGRETAPQVRLGFRLAFGREPAPREEEAAVRLVQAHGLAVLCRVLLNANEFVFVN